MLPKDPVILLSTINTYLRDTYPDMESLCDDKDVSLEEIDSILNNSGFFYDKSRNCYTSEE